MSDQIPEHLREMVNDAITRWADLNELPPGEGAVHEDFLAMLATSLHEATEPLVDALHRLELLGMQCCDESRYGSPGEHETSCFVGEALAPYRVEQEAS